MMRKCAWCSKESYELKKISVLSTGLISANRREVSFFVCGEHETNLRGFYDRVRRYGILFIGLCALLVFCLVVSAFSMGSDNYLFGYLFIGSFALIGLVVFVFPFCSPTTFEFMSIATSIKVARIMGGVIFAVGAIVFVLALLYG